MNTHNWAEAKKYTVLRRGEGIGSHLCLRRIPLRWEVNEFQSKEQIDMRFLSMMSRIEEWIKCTSDEEFLRLLELFILKKRAAINEETERKRIQEVEREERVKEWLSEFSEEVVDDE